MRTDETKIAAYEKPVRHHWQWCQAPDFSCTSRSVPAKAGKAVLVSTTAPLEPIGGFFLQEFLKIQRKRLCLLPSMCYRVAYFVYPTGKSGRSVYHAHQHCWSLQFRVVCSGGSTISCSRYIKISEDISFTSRHMFSILLHTTGKKNRCALTLFIRVWRIDEGFKTQLGFWYSVSAGNPDKPLIFLRVRKGPYSFPAYWGLLIPPIYLSVHLRIYQMIERSFFWAVLWSAARTLMLLVLQLLRVPLKDSTWFHLDSSLTAVSSSLQS